MGNPGAACREGCGLLTSARCPQGGEHPAPALMPWVGGKALAEQHQASSHLSGNGVPLFSSPGGFLQHFPILQLPWFLGSPRWSLPQLKAETGLKASLTGTHVSPLSHPSPAVYPGLKRIPAGKLSHKSCGDLLVLTVTPMCVCFLLPPT